MSSILHVIDNRLMLYGLREYCLLFGKEGYPGEAKIMVVHKYILTKQVRGTAVLQGVKGCRKGRQRRGRGRVILPSH